MSTNSKPRPKPWENNPPLDSQVSSIDNNSLARMTSHSHETHNEKHSEEPPPRPAELASDPQAGSSSMYNNSPYGGGGFGGGMYGNSMYGGGMGSMYGGGMGSMYGGGIGSMYGSGYGGFGSMYGNGYGGYMNAGPGGPGGLGESTQATFQLIESLIGTVAGFAQMLESTYMATHNSFFSMISVAEQFSYLKEILGSFFGIFALMKFVRRVLYYVTKGRIGTPPPRSIKNSASSEMVSEFQKFKKDDDPHARKRRKISWKPLLFFLIAVFGFPYALNKFITRVQAMQRGKIGTRQMAGDVDPSKLEFARALYDFTPENPQIETPLKKGELMAIITKQDPAGRESEWWKVRTKAGNMGYVPYNYIEIITRQKKIQDLPDDNSSPRQKQI
ncbi:related to Peroxisomal membrane protein PAS20 [Zygosaccharomyces bailii]|nr:related to Peroxisomal membrane protein PAS20 [Zygosaccharomyces bailii ISA1307]SJM88248.1 related to Peroxisomal membrane protein PAS20 [Zygosaccharomyces bailii]